MTVSVTLLVFMIVLLCLVMNMIVFVSEQHFRIGHQSSTISYFLPVNMSMCVRVVGHVSVGCCVL